MSDPIPHVPLGPATPSPAVALLALALGIARERLPATLCGFLDDWPVVGIDPRATVPHAVPVVRRLAPLPAAAPVFSAAFVTALAAAAPALLWRRSYSAAAVGAAFYEEYGWTEFAGASGPVPARRLACGVLVLGPGVLYPAHRHEAEEIYLPLVGTADWRQGEGPWRSRAPGSVIHHASQETHAMRTDRETLLALYLWRSDDVAQSSRLDAVAPTDGPGDSSTRRP